MSTFWDRIDAILVVNLKERIDRWEKTSSFIESIGQLDKLHRIDAVKGVDLPSFGKAPWFTSNTPKNAGRLRAGAAGCCLSHKKAIQYAQKKGFSNVLILEDDARFIDDLTGDFGNLIGDFLFKNRFTLFYLGFYRKKCPYRKEIEVKSGIQNMMIAEILGPLMFHAVVVNHSAFESMLNSLPSENDIWAWVSYWGSFDSWIQNEFGYRKENKVFGLMPSLVVQYANFSNICGRDLTVEESEGTHKKSLKIACGESKFKFHKNRSIVSKLYQIFKRNGRVVRNKTFGFKKS